MFLLYRLLTTTLGYFSCMAFTDGIQDRDICQPLWVTEYLVATFSDLFALYDTDDEDDYYEYIYPTESDGVIKYFYHSQIMEVLQWADYDSIERCVDFLTAVDKIQRENIPSAHLEFVQLLVSFSGFLFQQFRCFSATLI